MKLNIYSSKGVKKGNLDLPKSLLEKENLALLAQSIRVYENRLHKGTPKIKNRSEINASGAKIWRQKGTGRARHGDVKAPIFVGGGKAHGPDGLKKTLSLPQKMRKKALNIALSLKSQNGEVIVAESLSKLTRTKDAQKLLDEIIKKELKGNKANKITIALADENTKTRIFFRNIKSTKCLLFRQLNAYKVFYGGLIVIDKDAFSPSGAKTKSKKTSDVKKKKVQPKSLKQGESKK
jgi:large subunit ribosomal protein L4